MKRVWAMVAVLAGAALQAQAPRETQNFDRDWLFQQADATGASEPGFADAAWTRVDLPHDWAIYGPFEQTNPSGGAGAFAPAGVGCYRKHFTLPAADEKKRIFVEFDGVMANSDVWINGFALGHRPNGYVSFRYELTGHLKFGADNVIAVRADNSKQPSSRFYEGAGIYRHVRLLVMDPIHLAQWSTFVATTEVSADSANVHVQTGVTNQSDAAASVALRVTLYDPAGKVVKSGVLAPRPLAAGADTTLAVTIPVPKPDRWDLEHPVLYRAKVELGSGDRLADAETVNFGIREFHFDPDTGFWLNGKNFKIKGVALHSDVSSLGMAAPIGAWEHRLAAMKAMGANAIRTAHNPVAPEFLDLCDRMGFVVMDEMFDQWTVAKNPYDYHLYFREWFLKDTHDVVLRDRNHPSIVLYSAGNEIHDTPNVELAKSILGPLVAEFHKDDPTRPVTQALFRPNASHDYDDGLADMLDVVGQNYRPNEILAAHAQKKSRKIIGTENAHDRNQWTAVRDHPEYSGMFVWAGVDYLGESRRWPIFADSGGLNDRTDAPKPDSLERQSWWATTPVVHIARRVAAARATAVDPGYEAGSPQALALAAGGAPPAAAAPQAPASGDIVPPTVFPDWTPANLSSHEENVEVYSNCPEVELFLNGKSLGSQKIVDDASPRKWSVKFQPGELKAVGMDHKKPVATEVLRTAGKPAKLLLTVERAKLSLAWDDVAYVRATVVDADGIPVPDAPLPLTFSVSGPGKLLTTDTGNNADHSQFQKPTRVAYRGSVLAVVRATAATGSVTVHVDSTGLEQGTATLPIVP